MNDVLERLAGAGVVPVVVLEEVENAVPTANALLAGGVDVMEITFRTAAAKDSISAVVDACPDMLVGAGTVLNLDQCKGAVEAGAKFIVMPGFQADVVKWCLDHEIAVLPGCVTPGEIMAALDMGVKVLKFFPAGIYGGLKALKALAAPFQDVKFVPTGGVSASNLGEYIAAPFVHAVGGSWVCMADDIAAGRFEHITQLCREARSIMTGFEVIHLGINCPSAQASEKLCQTLHNAFGFEITAYPNSNFASSSIEAMKHPFLGESGHIALATNSMAVAVAELEKKGFTMNMETARYTDDRMTVVYLNEDFGGFAVHLVQR